MQIQPHDDHTLLSAQTQYGTPIQVYDDSWGPLWLYSTDPYGHIAMIIRTQTFEEAWDIAIDESVTILESELHEAYGLTLEEFKALDSDVDECLELQLQEGYRYQSNFTGTGIVETGHYEHLEPLTTEYVKAAGIVVKIGESS